MRAGELIHRIDLQSATETTDTSPGALVTWAAFDTSVPAAVVPMTGREQLAGQAIGSSVQYTVTLRYRTDVSAQHRVIWYYDDGVTKTLQVRAVILNADGRRRREMRLLCSELV